MARIRSIKPEFWQDSRMANQPALVRLVFVCLWSMADDEGRLEGDALAVWRFGSFREDSRAIASVLATLQGLGRIVIYEVAGNPYIQISHFTKHQRIDHPSKSKFPDHSNGCDLLSDGSRTFNESSRILAPDLEQGAGIREQGKDSGGLTPTNPPKPSSSELRQQATEVLLFLNTKTDRNFEAKGASLEFVLSRLKDGETVADCKAIIALKVREWKGNEKMDICLRPKTLFNRTNFSQYKGMLGRVEP